MIYAFPRVGRAGLGNCLFPWARAEVFAELHGAPIIAPQWSTIRLGPYLRREPEKRQYGKFFRSTSHINGVTRNLLLAYGRRTKERHFDKTNHEDGRRPLIIEFSGTGDLFLPLLPHFNVIRQRLWEMTRENLRPQVAKYGHHFIAMHIRRGDLTQQGFTDRELREQVTQYTPTTWFVGMAKQLRQVPETQTLPIVLFTDGSPDEVTDLARLPGVQLHNNQKAITDLWTLSSASILFASGYSTFSMWASFLGRMPTVYAPGKIQQRLQNGREDAYEIELSEHDTLPQSVLSLLS